MYREACEATRVRGEQSEETLDRRMICLDGRLEEVTALTALLAKPGASDVDHAANAVAALAPIATCGDVEALTAQVAPPRDARTRASVSELTKVLAQAKARADAGQFAAAREMLKEVQPRVAALGYAPLRADLEAAIGRVEQRLGLGKEAEASYRDAAYAAEEGRDDEVAARAWTELVYVVGYDLNRPAEAHELARQAEAAIKRMRGSRQQLEVNLLQNMSAVYDREGKLAESLDNARRVLPLREALDGPDARSVSVASSNLAMLIERTRPESPEAFAEALPLMERTLRIEIKQAGGEQHPDVADAYYNRGAALMGMDRIADAQASYERALAIGEKVLPATHIARSYHLLGMAEVRLAQGDFAAALPFAEQGLAIRVAALDGNQPELADAHERVAEALLGLGRAGEALAHAEKAFAIVGPASPSAVDYATTAGFALLRLGRHDEAGAHFTRALAIGPKVDPPAGPRGLAQARFGLARVKWPAGEHAEALRLANEARAGLATLPNVKRVWLREIDAWLATHH
jgi:tetratricopeptide (TPR) repeat protein